MALTQGMGAQIAVPLACILFVPLAQNLLQSWLLAFALAGKFAPGFASVMRCAAWLRPWSMAEVCLLGVLVLAVMRTS